jgi:hypothetical protein
MGKLRIHCSSRQHHPSSHCTIRAHADSCHHRWRALLSPAPTVPRCDVGAGCCSVDRHKSTARPLTPATGRVIAAAAIAAHPR